MVSSWVRWPESLMSELNGIYPHAVFLRELRRFLFCFFRLKLGLTSRHVQVEFETLDAAVAERETDLTAKYIVCVA